MDPDLHAPLGQNRPAGRRRWIRLTPSLAGGAAFTTAVLALSFYTMSEGSRFRASSPGTLSKQQQPPQSEIAQSATSQAGDARRSGSETGPGVERLTTNDGAVVTKYSPGLRSGSEPLILQAPRVGQDPRLAGTPNEDLLEDSPYGPLPVVGPDGLRPMDHYARPWSGARGTRIAIIVGGLGLSQTGTQRAIEELPSEITLAFAASGNSLQRWMQASRRQGHEILLQVPMEPFGSSDPESDPNTLLVDAPRAKNLERLHEAMASITGYTGIMNHLGGRLLSNVDALEPLLRDVSARGLLFLDDGSSARSTSGTLAKAIDLPHAFADMTLDGQVETAAILRKLDDLERLALRKGSAIGVASAFDESVQAIRQWVQEASRRGIEIVGVSALADDPTGYRAEVNQ